MTDRLTAWLRTIVPTLWSALAAWLVLHHVLPASLAGAADGLGATVAVPVVLAAVYAGVRWVEAQKWAPKWLVTLLLGSVRTPTYPPVVPAVPAAVPTPPSAPPSTPPSTPPAA